MTKLPSVVSALMLSTGALAQTAPPQPAQTPMTVVVTGSRIVREDTNTPSPVQLLTSVDIENSGYTSTAQLFQALTTNGEGNLNQGFSGAFAAGASGIALRGMTVDATLVLLDGHRMANYPIGDDGQRSFVDVANLPLSVIDHIEILKDGASAVYGADAIAGVVNIILKKSFTGGELLADGGTTDKRDATNGHASATWGFGDLESDGHNTYINLEARHQQALSLTARPRYSNFDYYHEFGPGAPVESGIVQPNAAYPFRNNLAGMTLPWYAVDPDPASGGAPGVGLNPQATFLSPCPAPQAGLGGCPYSVAPYTQIEPATTNYNVLLRHSMSFGEHWNGVFTGSMFQSKAEQLNQPSRAEVQWPGLTGGFDATSPAAQPVLVPVGNPNNPYNGNLNVPAWLAYTFGDVGPTTALTDTKMYRLVADVNGEVAGWNLTFSVGAMRGLMDVTYENFVTLTGLSAVLADNSYLIGAGRSGNFASVYSTLAPTTHSVNSSQLQYIDVGVTRSLFDLPGGPLAIAVGGGGRHTGQDVPGQPGTLSANVLGFGTTFIHGTETDENLYAELDAPLLKDAPFAKALELDLAGRWDNYASIGSSKTPKIGLKWQPLEQITVRGTYAKGFRPPGPGERGNSGVTFFTTAPSDDQRCPFTGLPTDCGFGGASAVATGDPNLSPETSRSYTGGIVLQPIPQISFAIDWWEVRRVNEITADFSDGNFIRGPVQAAYPNLPGPITSFVAPYRNLGQDEPKGIDYELHAKHDMGPGTLSADIYLTHLISQEVCQTADKSACANVVGTHGPSAISGNTGTPQNRGMATFSYDMAQAGGGFTINYVGGYKDIDPTLGTNDCLDSWFTECRTPSFIDVDAFGHFDVTKQLQVTAHILNLFDRPAPFDPQAAYNQNNYNFNFAAQGAIGRFYELGIRYRF
jgi:iron complex outermembrane receptor protein